MIHVYLLVCGWKLCGAQNSACFQRYDFEHNLTNKKAVCLSQILPSFLTQILMHCGGKSPLKNLLNFYILNLYNAHTVAVGHYVFAMIYSVNFGKLGTEIQDYSRIIHPQRY